MKADTLKNVLQTIIHFLDAEKHIDLQNDPGSDLETFLPEFNRYRKMLGLPTYILEKRIPMVGRGDWFGRGEKVRFVPSSPNEELVVATQEESPELISEKTALQTIEGRITKTALVSELEKNFSNLEVRLEKVGGIAVTSYYLGETQVASWSKGSGWYLG